MAIIIAVIAAVIVIALLITFNVRNTSAGQNVKNETREAIGTSAEQPEKHDPAVERSAEHVPVVVKSDSPKEKKNTMADDVYRQALQKFKTSDGEQPKNDPTSDKMQDSSYRDALLSLKNKKK
ncbi:hypothetical protein AXI59_06400 [Bacillus nakamurai]|uniref:Uncharacterized protein n=1 Tax=Bacillus nakamurai TaxID=1793963 RepID=A0A150F791_9BACI|nr:hypothetical protein [Bacillus nakamurai]KXZ20034.1 hypothetical protein AXI58_15775 [Bacillus nakamurai]KXZ23941.1 hypothetical protein AXI59_06400 [Bacillus nakamurai]MCC9023353.1 hypothetical protein [Bacillus nakamurai]MCP6682489.1 hypothetical protein [Bacillus nakamurai]MED1229571.1 hypothetical protein [Bacillus nakamurai]